ncbi:MAG: alkaline shock response membrane anchor protein AmaP [Candidatus Omnitrophica bacterium]|nr:alkaline shock response membrane anchor protein AmaP [Candidatus Omnitrophota bacterium]
MRLLMRIITIVYMAIFTALGAWLAAFALHLVPVDTVAIFFQTIYDDQNFRVACGLIGTGVILFNLMVFQFSWARFQRQRTIAFTNPDGDVTISLSAIEDFIRRAARQIPDIRDLKSDVLATKKGIEVTARVSLGSESHIPEVTEKIQGLIKMRVQEMLGIEDPVLVRIHVSKIVTREEGEMPPKPHRPESSGPSSRWIPEDSIRGSDYGVREES